MIPPDRLMISVMPNWRSTWQNRKLPGMSLGRSSQTSEHRVKSVMPILIEIQWKINLGNQFLLGYPRCFTNMPNDSGVFLHPIR